MTFVPIQEHPFIGSDRYAWLYNELKAGEWRWRYKKEFGIEFDNEDDAIAFILRFGIHVKNGI